MPEPGRATTERNPLGKGLQVLRAMLDAPEDRWGVRELARTLDMPPSTVHGVLSLLEQEGLVQSERESGQYRIGLELFRLAWQVHTRFPLRDIAMQFMRELVAQCDESVFLGLYDSGRMEMMFSAVVHSDNPLRYVVPMNEWSPVYPSASGLAILAFLPSDERQRVIEHVSFRLGLERTVLAPDVLGKELGVIRERGYACTHGRRIPGAVGVAAPIWGPDSKVVGDLVLTIPEHRFDSSKEEELGQLLSHYARRVTELLT